MVTPDFIAMNNRKQKCKKCGVQRNAPAFNEKGLCKECARVVKNNCLGSFLK
jgi:hypothetical protein